jgi:hypothetical protein
MKLLVALVLLASASVSSDAAHGDAQTLLSQMKAACGGSAWDRVQSWHETSRVDLPDGRTIENEVWHDMHSLKSAMIGRVDGKIVRRAGFDGTSYWRAGADGRVQTGSESAILRQQRRDAYLSSFGWFFPERFPATFRLGSDVSLENRKFQVLHISPQGADSFDLWLDPGTHLVRRIVAGPEYADLSEYKVFDGVCTATRWRQGTGNPKSEVVLHVLSVATTVPAQPSVFVPPLAPEQ